MHVQSTSTRAQINRQTRRERLKDLIAPLGKDATYAEITDTAARAGFGGVNPSMLRLARAELWPEKYSLAVNTRGKDTEVILPEGYIDACTCPKCGCPRTHGHGLQHWGKFAGKRIRRCQECKYEWAPEYPDGVVPNKRMLYAARLKAATAEWCNKCQRMLPIDKFRAKSGAPELVRSGCVECLNTQRGKRQIVVTLAKYGLTVEQYEAILAAQGGRCAICREENKSPNVKYVPLCVDHCHDTGKFRGLLCNKCNLGMGNFDDDPERMEAAAEYVRRAKGRHPPTDAGGG